MSQALGPCSGNDSFSVIRHENGAIACIDPRPSSRLACVSIRVKGGSDSDPLGKSGLAHLFEHLLFAGTPRFGRDMYMAAIEDEGAYPWAKTGASWITFSTVCSPDVTPKILAMETERFARTVSFLTAPVIEREKLVVRNERSQRVDSTPYGDALEHLLGKLYRHPTFGRIPVGIDDEVASISLDDCMEYFGRAFCAEHVNIAVSGNVVPHEISHAITCLMGAFPVEGKPAAEPRRRQTGSSSGPEAEVFIVPTKLPPKIYVGYLLPSAEQAAYDEARVAAYLLGKGQGSYLQRELVDHREAVLRQVQVKTLTRVGVPSVGIIEATPREGVPTESARHELRRVLGALESTGIGAGDAERARASYLRSWYHEDDTVRGRCDGLSLALLRSGSPSRYLRELIPAAHGGPVLLRRALDWWKPDRIAAEVIYQ